VRRLCAGCAGRGQTYIVVNATVPPVTVMRPAGASDAICGGRRSPPRPRAGVPAASRQCVGHAETGRSYMLPGRMGRGRSCLSRSRIWPSPNSVAA